MIFGFGKYKIDVDVERTKMFYESLPSLSVCCSCAGCRNFVKAVNALPKEMMSFFEILGVDITKAVEIYVNCEWADGTVYYGGFCHLCGMILEGENQDVFEYNITDDFSVWFRSECHLLEKDFPRPAFQMELDMKHIPWVLEDVESYFAEQKGI